ncbi:MAG: family 20 glycosylhydrolase [Tannerellaceae bacterium]|jgi:hexosaminidase|nr:family 20 glycosylhydrolase [Tannerellaceae bacterium]
MRKLFITCASAALILFASCGTTELKSYNQGINIIPAPLSLEQQEGTFLLTHKTVFVASTPEARTVADFFVEKLRKSTGYTLGIVDNATDANSISLIIDASQSVNDEGYTLDVDPRNVTIKAQRAQGLFYGMQTFLQLMPAEIENPRTLNGIAWSVPAVKIKDEPRFAYRGVMLDPCRHFIPVENVKKQLDVLALFKINRMHWHLTDDQGWRIEIKQYPRLTEIGSKSNNSEGFYTQEQIREIVEYAAKRYITIIPEIELPGHELAAISAYPELSCTGEQTTPRLVWGVEDVVLCAGKESTFEFLENVFKEVVELFPSEYFHIGGDECPKESWYACSNCQKRIKELGFKSTEHISAEQLLQSWFIQRMEKFLADYGKKIIGWDEILEGGLAPTATVMSWRGEAGGIAAAFQDHDVIMTPGGTVGMYIDQFQGDPKIEPVAIGGYNTLENVYKYNPIPDTLLSVGMAHHVKGVQSNLWGEYLYTTDILEYRGYPRILALSEIAWTMPEKKDYPDFERRLNNALVRLDGHGINYHIPQPEQPYGSCNFVAFTDKASLEFKTTRPIKVIYTTDGSEPNSRSMVYESPIEFTETGVLKIRSILPSGKMSPTRTITVEKQSLSTAATLSQPGQGLRMRIAYGEFQESSQLDEVQEWTDSIMHKWRNITGIQPYSHSMRNYKQYAAIAEGFVDIPEDGVYYFSSENEEVWIDGKLLVDNKGEVKWYSRNDKSMALAKGYHEIRVVFLGHIIGGRPSNWCDGSVSIRKEGDERFAPIKPEALAYQQ